MTRSADRVLILGAAGMLGHKLYQVLSYDLDVFGTLRSDFSKVEHHGIFDRERIVEGVLVEDTDSVIRAIEITKPDIVINAIGIVKQLPTADDVISTLTVNSIFPHQVAKLAGEYGFRFITFSTDCVFAGTTGNYTESDTPDAADLYGRSKQLGEVVDGGALTIRTSIIGRELSSSHSLLDWFLGQTGSVDGFANAYFSGFPTIVLAELTARIINEFEDLNGIYHISSERINKYDLLSLIKKRTAKEIGINRVLEPHIDRSLDSSRFRSATGFLPLDWEEMVDRIFSDPTPYR